jgi:uncharacterized protein with PIN domain
MLFYQSQGARAEMKVERSEDLIYWTYHMIDWRKAVQTPSAQRCVNCENEMSVVEAIVGKGSQRYLGLVCHRCERVIWVKAD